MTTFRAITHRHWVTSKRTNRHGRGVMSSVETCSILLFCDEFDTRKIPMRASSGRRKRFGNKKFHEIFLHNFSWIFFLFFFNFFLIFLQNFFLKMFKKHLNENLLENVFWKFSWKCFFFNFSSKCFFFLIFFFKFFLEFFFFEFFLKMFI